MLAALLALPQEDPDKKGRLKEFEKTLKDPQDRPPKRPPEEHPHRRPPAQDDDEDDDLWAELLADTVGWLFLHPFTDQALRFDDYPYGSGRRYFLRSDDTDKELAWEPRARWIRIDHDLDAMGLGGTMRLPSGCDFTFDVTRYHERLPGTDDVLTLQKYEINYGMGGTRARALQWTLGWGVAALTGVGSDLAFSLQSAVQWMAAEPLSVRFEIAVISFEGGSLTDLDLEVRWHVSRAAVSLGYRSLIISGGPDLSGPSLGLAVFF